MNPDLVEEALDGMTRRDLEAMKERIERRLVACLVCGQDGGIPRRLRSKGTDASLVVCPSCFEKHRLPVGRAEETHEAA